MNSPTNYVFFGPPGSGKGTQAQKLAREFNLCHLSTGDMLRAAVKEGTEAGKKAKVLMEKGEFVTDSIVTAIIRDAWSAPSCNNGFILDGYPRNAEQAETLEGMLRVKKDRLHHVINFQIDDDVVIRRISGRLSHPASGRVYNAYFAPPKVPNKDDITGEPLIQRSDDKEEVIKKRLSVYHQYADELIEYYRKKNLVRTVNAQQSIDTVYNYLKTFFK